jgi:hypothetical protein
MDAYIFHPSPDLESEPLIPGSHACTFKVLGNLIGKDRIASVPSQWKLEYRDLGSISNLTNLLDSFSF